MARAFQLPLPRVGVLVALLGVLLSLLACRPHAGLPDGPPTLDEGTARLPSFDPAALAGPGGTGLDLAQALAGPPAPPEPPDPAVVDYSPTEDAGAYTSIQLRFNRAMVPLGDKRRMSAAEAGFVIAPPLEGEAYWAEPTRLVFDPTEELPPAQEYQVRFTKTLESVDGPSVDVNLQWSFATERPRVSVWTERSYWSDGHHWKSPVAIALTQDASRKSLLANLEVRARKAGGELEPVEFELRELPRDKWGQRYPDFQLRPKGRWPAGGEVVVRVDAGFTSKAGPRPMGYDEVHSFAVVEGFEPKDIRCSEGHYADGCEIGPIVVNLSSPIRRNQASRFSISPEPKRFDVLAINRDYDEEGRPRNAYHSVMIWGDFALGETYEIHVDDRLRDIHGQAYVGPSTSESITFVEPPTSLALERSRGIFEFPEPAKIGVESRHLDSVRVRALLLQTDELAGLIDEDIPLEFPAGRKPRERVIKLSHSGKFGWSSHELDLASFAGGKPAAILYEVAPAALLPRARGRGLPSAQRGLIQHTNLGVSAVGSVAGGAVRVATISDDRPVAGAEVSWVHRGEAGRLRLGKTNAEGLIDLPPDTDLSAQGFVLVEHGDDRVMVDAEALGTGHGRSPEGLRPGESVRAAITTERPLYKPGERVRLIGWTAVTTPHEWSGLRKLPKGTKVEIELRDVRDEVVATRTVTAKEHGKFWVTLDLPTNAALGVYHANATLLEQTFSTNLQVKDFVTPQFEVSAETEHADIHHGESTRVSVNANYYFGGRVPITRLRYANECVEQNYRPPGLDAAWSVGPRRKTWVGYGLVPFIAPKLDPSAKEGHAEYSISPGSTPDRTVRCTHSVAVADLSEREVGAEASLWVHPAFYLAAKVPAALEAGEDAAIELRTLDFDGSLRPAPEVEVVLTRSWTEAEIVVEKGERRFAGWRERTKTLPACRSDAKAGVARCDFAKLGHGSYEVKIRAKEGEYEVELDEWFWVREPRSSNQWSQAPVSSLTVEVDKKEPRPGEKVRVQVRAPWTDGRGILLVNKGGLREVRPFALSPGGGSGGAAELEFEVDDAWIPGAEFRALAIEPATAKRPAQLRTAVEEIEMSSDSRRLAVAITAPREAQTGETIPIEVRVRDAAGQPATGHVAVWAVDEAVLSLAPFELPDFVSVFAAGGIALPLGVVTNYQLILLGYAMRSDPYSPRRYVPGWASGGSGGLGSVGYGAGGAGYAGGIGLGGKGGATMPATRSEFSSAPIFIADAELDADGVARLEGTLPDNLTTFRLSAVASSPLPSGPVEARFGSSDARVRVTRPLVVRAALPRILRPGDLAEIGVLVDNLRGGEGELAVEVELHEAEGLIQLLDPPTATATVAAGGQLRLPFRVRALATGSPAFEVRAVLQPKDGSAPIGDGVRLPLPVEAERTLTDRVAVYGNLGEHKAALLPFVVPREVDPNFGGLSVSVGSSMLGGVEDAVAYLVDYPYGCLEQTSSSLLPLIPLGRLAADYPLGIGDTKAYVDAGIARLRSMQLDSGGFSYWPGGAREVPFASAYATWVLTRADEAGYEVPGAMLDDARRYLLELVSSWRGVTGPSLGQDIEMALILATLAETGLAPQPALATLYARRARLPVFSQAMLLLALEAQAHSFSRNDPRIAELLGELRGLVDEREGVAKVETGQGRWTFYWDSDVRSSALVLMAMLRADPMHPLAPKLTRGLLEARRGGRWANTQENAFALVALADYAAVYESEFPEFEGRVWLGNQKLAAVEVEGRSFEFDEALTPMKDLLAALDEGQDERLILERAGQGRMYYRVGLEWASTATNLPAKAEGIALSRSLRTAAGPVGPGGSVASGQLVAIDLTLEIRSALDHVAVEVPLPAGLEAIDLELGKGQAARKLSGRRAGWVSHQELHRDRALIFADHLIPGTHTTTVFLLSTTPGQYVVPAASAEMMYYPEVYGRTTADALTVN